jgi:hypothetical protein
MWRAVLPRFWASTPTKSLADCAVQNEQIVFVSDF